MRDENDSTMQKAPLRMSHIGFVKKSLEPKQKKSPKKIILRMAKSTNVKMPRMNCPYLPFLLTLRVLF